ncbi:hypothetical protein HGM15179_018107, partial [Zosterops borbonicus]
LWKKPISSRPDPKDAPDWKLCADESSFMRDGKQIIGYAVTSTNKVTREKALPSNVSSQRADYINERSRTEQSHSERKKTGNYSR